MSPSFHSPGRNPVDLALQHVTETKRLLEQLIQSSESFDYHHAKKTLQMLQKKIRQLARLQSNLEAHRHPPAPQVCRVDFHSADPSDRQTTSE